MLENASTRRQWRARRNHCWKSGIKSSKKKNERTGLKIFTPNKLSTRLPMLLAQLKAGNNSYKSTTEIEQILYLLYQHNKIIEKVYNSLIKSL